MILITGYKGLLGSELMKIYPDAIGTTKGDSIPENIHLAYLTGGTKSFHECEGREDIFRSDVDYNIRAIKKILHNDGFVVFISSEAVEKIGHGAAYSRNRLLVEQFLWTQPRNAIIRPSRFDSNNVKGLVTLCAEVGELKSEGIFHWS